MSLPKMHRILGLAGALWLAQASAQAGQEPAPAISWQASYQQALEQARATNKPVLIAVNQTGDEASDDFVANFYHARRITKEAQGYVPLIACAEAHAEVEAEDGSGRMVCSRFGSVRCEEHIAVERAVRAAFFPDYEEILAPQHIILRPNGKPIAMRGWWMSERQLEKLLADARSAARRSQNDDRLERDHVVDLITQASSGDADSRDDALAELTVTLAGWSSELAIDLVRSRAPAPVRQGLVSWLPEMGGLGETALLALLDDPLPTIRQQVVDAIGADMTDRARERLTQRLSTERDQRVRRSISALLAAAEASAARG